MKSLEALLTSLSGLVSQIPPLVLALAVVVAPILTVLALGFYKRFKAWRAARKAAAAVEPRGATAEPAGAAIGRSQLRDAWLRFVGNLPADYRRSILGFDHFVVLGADSSDKSQVIDSYTDWQEQAKQFTPSQKDDKDLPVYLGSTVVTMDIPARVLNDTGAACRKALERLWRPLYQRVSPTVVVVIDVRSLEEKPEAVKPLAHTIGGKIDLLSSICGRALEVRVVLTHLESIEGYAEFASFFGAQKIAMRVDLSGNDDAGARLDVWLDEARQHLPRALTSLEAHAYLRVVSFLRIAPRRLAPLRSFLDPLFAAKSLSFDRIRGGIFLASSPAGAPSPFVRSSGRRSSPDPRIRHVVAAALVASGMMTFIGASFVHQRDQWETARDSFRKYKLSVEHESELMQRERDQRGDIVAFTDAHGWLDTHPNFFQEPREKMRRDFSERIRTDLLIPLLHKIVKEGTALQGKPSLRHQRSLYCLALIHSDKRDKLGILLPKDGKETSRLDIWQSMTGIEPGLITDYLNNTDTRLHDPVVFELEGASSKATETGAPWRTFFERLMAFTHDGVISTDELFALQEQAKELEGALELLENANVTLDILRDLDRYGAASPLEEGDDQSAIPAGLAVAYDRHYNPFLEGYKAFRELNVQNLAQVLHTVREARLDVKEPSGLLSGLVDTLQRLSDAGGRNRSDPTVITLDGGPLSFDERTFQAALRKGKARLLIHEFTRNAGGRSIFFAAEEPPSLPWHPTGNAAGIFAGGEIKGRYRRAAYEGYVGDPVRLLRALLGSSTTGAQYAGAKANATAPDEKIVDNDREQLEEVVRKQVEQYSSAYEQQTSQFIKGFELSTPSVEALRVALSLMSDKDGKTTFDDFLTIVDSNTTVDVHDPATNEIEPMLEPMKKNVVDYFARWHEVAGGNGGAPKVAEYKAILAQMVNDLAPVKEALPGEATKKEAVKEGDPPTAGGNGPAGDTLELALTPTGRLVLKDLSSVAGAYPAMIRGWVKASGLPSDQQGPFLAPLTRVSTIGRQNIQSVVWAMFRRDFLPDLERVSALFPFDPAASEEVTPEDLTKLFHPREGRIYDLFRRYLEPLSQMDGNGGFRSLPSVQQSLDLPAGMYRIVNAVAGLSARLWDAKGKPRPLRYHLRTVPLGRGPSETSALTLVQLKVGSGLLSNFNQKPTTTSLDLDWTTPSTSQVSAQLTNTESKEKSDPEPILTEASCFSFLRLLRKAKPQSSPPGQPAGVRRYAWEIVTESGAKLRAELVVEDESPWETFALGKAVKDVVKR